MGAKNFLLGMGEVTEIDSSGVGSLLHMHENTRGDDLKDNRLLCLYDVPECVEQVLGLNIVRTHMKACFEVSLPKFVNKPSVFCARLILLAQKRLIAPALTNFDQVRDVPMPGAIIEKGEPICSIIIEEETRNFALEKAGILAKLIRERF